MDVIELSAEGNYRTSSWEIELCFVDGQTVDEEVNIGNESK